MSKTPYDALFLGWAPLLPLDVSSHPLRDRCGSKAGCTYVHKANEAACGVSDYGCYQCSSLPADCPDCYTVEAA